MTPRRMSYLDSKGKGNKSMTLKRERLEGMYSRDLQRLNDRVKAGLPEPQHSGVQRTPIDTMPVLRCWPQIRVQVALGSRFGS
jgi:hypothetical protein